MTGQRNDNAAVALRLRRPSEAGLAEVLDAAVKEDLQYARDSLDAANGFSTDRWTRTLGAGQLVFARACAALRAWEMHTGAGLTVHRASGAMIGGTVAMSAPLPLGHVELTCRILEVIDEPSRCGFVYGTLPNHPELGEETFVLSMAPDGEVTLDIVSRWKLRHPLGRLAPPVATWLQRRATMRYLDAMSRIVGSAPSTP